MNIEKEIFSRYIILEDKLLQYGFKKENDKLVYYKKILNNTFKIIIEYYDNNIKGKIIDLSFNDEYTNFRGDIIGEFNKNVKKEFEEVLLDIRDKCCEKRNFIYNQSNRINDYIENKFNSNPEFLWDKYPNYAVYKNKNNKWFSIIMNIQINKIEKKTEDEVIIEIINVKISPNKKDELLKMNGVYEAYHMNKKSWISIRLDDTLEDEKIFELIDNSYNLITKNKL